MQTTVKVNDLKTYPDGCFDPTVITIGSCFREIYLMHLLPDKQFVRKKITKARILNRDSIKVGTSEFSLPTNGLLNIPGILVENRYSNSDNFKVLVFEYSDNGFIVRLLSYNQNEQLVNIEDISDLNIFENLVILES